MAPRKPTEPTPLPPAVEGATDPLPTLKEGIETAIIEQMQAAQIATLTPPALPFSLTGFKLNGKAKDYPGDDDPTVITRKVAFAVLALGDSGFRLQANIYRVTYTAIKNDAGKTKVVTRCTMPNSGKMGGFKPIIDTDDAREQRALDDFRRETAQAFKVWAAGLAGGKGAITTAGTTRADDLVDFE